MWFHPERETASPRDHPPRCANSGFELLRARTSPRLLGNVLGLQRSYLFRKPQGRSRTCFERRESNGVDPSQGCADRAAHSAGSQGGSRWKKNQETLLTPDKVASLRALRGARVRWSALWHWAAQRCVLGPPRRESAPCGRRDSAAGGERFATRGRPEQRSLEGARMPCSGVGTGWISS